MSAIITLGGLGVLGLIVLGVIVYRDRDCPFCRGVGCAARRGGGVMFVPIPDEEMPAVMSAMREGRCIVCYRAFDGEGFYCPDCDDAAPDDDPDDGVSVPDDPDRSRDWERAVEDGAW